MRLGNCPQNSRKHAKALGNNPDKAEALSSGFGHNTQRHDNCLSFSYGNSNTKKFVGTMV
jgi:hypothetical protein